MKLLGIIVNYRTPELTMSAARSLAAAIKRIPSARFVIVDNQSADGSYERLREDVARESWSGLCEVLEAPRNGGFGYGNNLVIKQSLASRDPAEYFYLLNPDACAQPDAVEKLVEFMDNHRYAGIAGSYVCSPEGKPDQTAFRFPTAVSDFEQQAQTGPISKLLRDWVVALPIPEQTMLVDWTAAVSMVLRASMLKKVGLFDEDFFLYFEETDLCRRAAMAGFPTYYVRESQVSHIGSAVTGLKDLSRPMPKYWFDARAHYFRKHHGDRYLTAANLAWLGGRALRGARRVLELRRDVRQRRITRDFVAYNFLASSSKGG